MHMNNPHAPAIHFNTRFIYTTHGWFGGGMDVTPCIKDDKEKNYIHNELRKMCDRHDKTYYKKYKKWCDEYFYLPHRKEARGIGGIFFDYKKDNWEKDFKFISDLGITFQMLFNSIIKTKYKKKMDFKRKRNCSILKEEDILNLICFMIGEQNLGYKQEATSKVF